MAPISPGTPSGPPRKAKKPTATTKSHRFEPFNKRISRLKIDPIHRVEPTQTFDGDTALTHSHFRETLDHWTDLNLSQTYTDFARKASPLSESLPQLLHHADAIFALLVEHIEKKDALALEALLSLLAQFAQDLRQKFEKYFSKTVTLVAYVAASHDAPDVIEWCFTCLAWIFKFLQRLLVPNLEPLLSIMVPYLGARKAYVVRFTAESLAFLLRKAAMLYPRNEAPLSYAVTYLLRNQQDYRDDQAVENYKVGLMTLFSEAAAGSDNTLHASGPHLLSCIMKSILGMTQARDLQIDVLEGLTISLVHQTDSEGFSPFLAFLHSAASSLSSASSDVELRLIRRLLYLVVATRKGSRIQVWSDTIQDVLRIRDMTTRPESVSDTQECLYMIALIMQYAPMNELLPSTAPLLQAVTNHIVPSQFYQFCDFFASLGVDRFRSLLLPRFQQYILSHWQENEAALCLCLQTLSQEHAVSSGSGTKGGMLIPNEWERHMVKDGLQRSRREPFDVLLDAYLRLANDFSLPQDASNRQSLKRALHEALTEELNSPLSPCKSAVRRFIFGRVFSQYVDLALRDQDTDGSLWSKITNLPPDHFRLSAFLTALDRYAEVWSPYSLSSHEILLVQEHLLDNLLSTSAALKSASLKLMKHFSQQNQSSIETIDLALEVLEMPYSPQHVRQIAMLLRRLPRYHKNLPEPLRAFVPQFCMGLLPSYFDNTRGVVCEVLGELSKEGEEQNRILEIALKWLQAPGSSAREREDDSNQESLSKLTPFQCSNVLAVNKDTQNRSAKYDNLEQALLETFESDHQVHEIHAPAASRSIALQLFRSMPEIAEKRSRLLVPVFLAAENPQMIDIAVPDSNESTSSRTLSPSVSEAGWTLRDRKAFLELLGMFQNPRVLYRSNEVHAALLGLLTNGSVEVQRLSLKAISTWKEPSLMSHYDALLRLLDDKTFSTEIAILLTSNLEESPIETPQRAYVVDIILRLLYGQMIGRSGSHGSQEGKRRTILRMILRLPESEISQFLKLSFKGLAEVKIVHCGIVQTDLLERDLAPLDQQYGTLRMVHSVMEILQSQLAPLGSVLIHPVLYCTTRACHQLRSSSSEEELAETVPVPVMIRNIRKIGLQCLDMLFKHCSELEWSTYLDLIFSEIISPRLSHFAVETAQSVSWLLRIFSTWAHSSKMVQYLYSYDKNTLPNVVECLTTPSVRDEVKVFVLDEILTPMASLASEISDPSIAASEALQFHAQILFESIAQILTQGPSKQVLQASLVVLPILAPFARSTLDSQVLLESLLKVLNDSNLHVSPKIRGNLLRAVESVLEIHGPALDDGSRLQIWANVSALFNYFKDVPNRIVLCHVVNLISSGSERLSHVATICGHLNTASSGRLAEVDIERQIRGFNEINNVEIVSSTQEQWLPLLNNLLYYSRTSEDFTVRSNAVACLKRFIVESCRIRKTELEALINDLLLPALKKGINEDSETVRADFVSLFGLVVQTLQEAPELDCLKPLLVHDDDEASFFSNILHIQHHRRLRALRRLSVEVERGRIQASQIATFFLPLLEKFVSNADDDSNAQSLKGQSISTIGSLLLWLEWKQFKATFRRYKRGMGSQSRSDKDAIKLLGVSTEALVNAAGERDVEHVTADRQISHLASSLPTSGIISGELKAHFIPQLTAFVHLKDETQISLRLPAAVTVVKLIKLLPEENMIELLPPLLLDTSQILRSRTQESRDAARNVLAEIVTLLGPSSLHFVIKELRATLNRGYQLHVVSYTLHTILLALTPRIKTGAMDYCLSDLVTVIMDDIFGAVGQEKENQDYISSMREVKSSKSFDSMELLSTCAGVSALSKLLRPLQALLEGNLNTKQARQVDELLRRTGMGLSRNEAANSRDLLIFSYELIQDFYRQRTGTSDAKVTNDEKNRARYLVQPAYAVKSAGGISSPLLYKIPRFALDIARSTFQKHAALLKAENVHGFLPIIGDALIEAQEDVKTSALRLLSAVIKLPMSRLDEGAEVYIAEAVKIIKSAVSTNTEASQAALKLLSAMLRERKSVDIRSADLAYLLHRILPDLEHPDRQGVTFNFVKAVMARKIALPEVYEIADKLGIMMVTNHAREAREMARGVYVHFLLDYPQTKSRWSKQLKFLLKNLEYQHPEGRQSVMEALNTLLAKIGDGMVEEIVSSFFIPVVLRMANDENKDCRELAEALLGQLFRKAGRAQLQSLVEPLMAWIEQTDNPALTKLGMQAFGTFFDVSNGDVGEQSAHLRSSIEKALAAYAKEDDDDWEHVYHALELLSKIVTADPASAMSRKQAGLWSSICSLQSSRQPVVQEAVSRLIGIWFHDLAKNNAEGGLGKIPLTGQYGLILRGETMIELLRTNIRLIKRNKSSDDGITQLVRNLMFLCRCFCVNDLNVQIRDRSKDDEAEADEDDDADHSSASDDDEPEQRTKDIPAIHYLLHQWASILRHEPPKATTASLQPKKTTLALLASLMQHIPAKILTQPILHTLLLPLTHLTDPHITAPRSADPAFAPAHTELTAAAHEAMEAIQKKVGDAAYVATMAGAARSVRERRQQRRTKRVVERVTEPERAARKKRRIGERKVERKRELTTAFRRARRGA